MINIFHTKSLSSITLASGSSIITCNWYYPVSLGLKFDINNEYFPAYISPSLEITIEFLGDPEVKIVISLEFFIILYPPLFW